MTDVGKAPQDCDSPQCLGNYDFEHIARYARRRFVDGIDTLVLLEQAQSMREKEEIALVAMLDVEDNFVRYMRLNCRHAEACDATDCRDRLKQIIERDLADKHR